MRKIDPGKSSYLDLSSEVAQALRDEIKSRMLETPRYVGLSALEALGDPEIWKEEALQVPTLAVYARTPDLRADHGEYMGRLFPDMEYHEWEGAGHFLMMEQPGRFNELLIRFLKQLG